MVHTLIVYVQRVIVLSVVIAINQSFRVAGRAVHLHGANAGGGVRGGAARGAGGDGEYDADHVRPAPPGLLRRPSWF